MIKRSTLHHHLVYHTLLSSLLLCFLIISSSAIAQNPDYPVKIVNGKKFYEYTVQPKEGFYRLKVKFNIHEDELIMYNPQAKEGLQEGMKLLIPIFDSTAATKPDLLTSQTVKKPGKTSTTTSGTPEPTFTEHRVEKKQTIFRIRKLYDISEDDLLKYNPQLQGRSLQEGDILKIPVKADPADSKKNKQIDQPTVQPKAIASADAPPPPVRVHKQHYRIAFLLPFLLDQKNETADSRFVEFYSGALMAINQAKNRGRTIEVFTFDTEKSDLKVMEILNDTIFRSIDLIIGPAYSNQVSLVCDFARANHIPTLIPFTSRIYDLESNEYIYQFNPGQETELFKLTELLTLEALKSQLIIVENPYVAANDEGNQLIAQLKVHLKNSRTDFKHLEIDPSNTTAIRSALSATRENIILFNTNRINSLSGQMRQLIQLSDSFQIKIYEPYSWKTTKTEKPASFYLSVFRTEYPDKAYEEYMQHFGEIFGWLPVTEHPRYDLLGFDLVNYYFSNADIPATLKKANYPKFEGIQSTIQFEKISEKGGYINRQLNHYE